MDKELLVERTRKALKGHPKNQGDFSLIMLVADDPSELDSKFSLLVSAPWMDAISPREGIELILKTLKASLSDLEFSYITRVHPINSADGFVKTINSTYHVRDRIVDIMDSSVSGTYIGKGIIVEST